MSFRRLRWQWWPGVLHPRFERSFWNLRKHERGEGRNFLFSTKVVQHFLLQLVKKLWFTMGRCVGAFIHATPFPDLQHLVKFHFLPLPLAGPLHNEPEGHRGGFRDRATFLKQKKMGRFFGSSVKRDYSLNISNQLTLHQIGKHRIGLLIPRFYNWFPSYRLQTLIFHYFAKYDTNTQFILGRVLMNVVLDYLMTKVYKKHWLKHDQK